MKLFISYSYDDKNWVYELWRALCDKARHDAWMDRRSTPADDWWQTTLSNIEGCECFLYILSPKASTSIYTRAELNYALALNKPVLLMMLKPCDVPPELSQRRIAHQTITVDPSLDRVLYKIEQGLGEIQLAKSRGQYTAAAARRPAMPQPAHQADQVTEAYMVAEDAALADNPSLAERLFSHVIEADPQGWGRAAAERVSELRAEYERNQEYLILMQLAKNPASIKSAQIAAERYVEKYGMDYDPNNVLFTLVTPTAPFSPTPLALSDRTKPRVQVVSSPSAQATSSRHAGQAGVRAAQPGEVRMDAYGVPMVYVPAGKFMMGSDPKWDKNAQDREQPQHEIVFAQGFWIDQFPVINDAYAAFVRAGGYRDPQWWTKAGWQWVQTYRVAGPRDYDGLLRPQQPRVGLRWAEALAYARWRSARLPTEAEWEYAARGPQNLIYPWGNQWNPDYLVWKGNSGERPADVGSKPNGRSWVNAYDMAGNVWEWCSSIYKAYPYHPNDGREDTNVVEFRVLRGGSCFQDASGCRAAFSHSNFLSEENAGWGFRCARTSL